MDEMPGGMAQELAAFAIFTKKLCSVPSTVWCSHPHVNDSEEGT